MWLTRGTLIRERFSLLFFLFYVTFIALGPALLQYIWTSRFSLVSFFCVLFFSILLFFVIFNISLFGFCSALHRSGLQLDLIMYNHCNVSWLISRQHFSFFYCLSFNMSHWSKGWKVLGMCCYDYDLFFTVPLFLLEFCQLPQRGFPHPLHPTAPATTQR